MKKVTDGTDYLEFIHRLNDTCRMNVQLSNVKSFTDEGCSVYSIRHDVDKDIDQALKMARFEFDNSIQSTYFLLHTAKYFDYTRLFLEKCQAIEDMGHDIGIHNDAVIEWLKLTENEQISRGLTVGLEAPLRFLREGDIEVKGTSAHGSDKNYKRKVLNYELWKEYDDQKNIGLSTGTWGSHWKPQMSLSDFDLEYEAYFLPYTHYLSDSGGNWLGYKVEGQKMFERDLLNSDKNTGLKVIEDFEENGGFLQVLIHPCWWKEK